MKYSNTAIQCFKSCRRLYELKYLKGIQIANKSQSLERGTNYHSKLEQLFKNGDFEKDENIKSNAMVMAFKKYIFPKLNIVDVEKWFEYSADENQIIGRIDGLNSDGFVVEHKTTSLVIDGNYWNALEMDEQILTYMIAMNTNRILYTVCRTPTIRQTQNETDEDFENRCIEWYDKDTESKIAINEIIRTEQRLEDFKKMQIETVKEISNCKLFYRCPSNCQKWGRMCEYAPICMMSNYDEMIAFAQNLNEEEENG